MLRFTDSAHISEQRFTAVTRIPPRAHGSYTPHFRFEKHHVSNIRSCTDQISQPTSVNPGPFCSFSLAGFISCNRIIPTFNDQDFTDKAKMDIVNLLLCSNSSQLLLALLILIAAYLTSLVFTPPHPNPVHKDGEAPTDRVHRFASPGFLLARKGIFLSLGIWHALITLQWPTPFIHTDPPTERDTPFCPRPENLNQTLFAWNAVTIVCVFGILIAAPIRLLAFRQLGENFTFRLAKPKGLVKTGLYRYVQHPSYATNFVVIFANGWLMMRVDGVVGCVLPRGVVSWGGWWWIGMGLIGLGVYAGTARVRDEEKMLKETFGEKWVEWSGRTKRFVPGVF